MVKINNLQMRKIYAMAKELSMDNELLHAFILNNVQKEHISELSKYEAMDVIDKMDEMKTGVKKTKTYRENMATQDQIYKIRALERELGWNDNPKRLKAFTKKYTGVENLNWLTFSKASNLIESLKKVAKREELKRANNQ